MGAVQLALLPNVPPPACDLEYRALLARFERAWEARYGRVSAIKRAGGWLDPGDFAHWRRGVQIHRELGIVRGMRAGGERQARLRQLLVTLENR
jgi:hypothetical protein